MNEFFGKLQDLNTRLDQQMLLVKPDQQKPFQSVSPSDEDDSRLSSSVDAMAPANTSMGSNQNRDANPLETTLMTVTPVSKDGPFLVEITAIMEDVESSVQWYIQEMIKTVLQCLGGVEMTSYLGHIFTTKLNFQTSMWQLVMTEAVNLPTVMREQLCWETGTLHLFTQVIPFLGPCLVPPLPLPVVGQPTPQASGEIPGTSGGKPPLPSLPEDSQTMIKVAGAGTPTPMQVTPMNSMPKQSTKLSGRQRLQLKGGSKLLSCAPAPIVSGNEGTNTSVSLSSPVKLGSVVQQCQVSTWE